MAALAPPVAAVRSAVRRALTGLPGAGPVLVACSGGADSLALAAATAFVAPRLGRRAGLVTVDHGLQPGSAERAAVVAAWARELGLDPVEAVRVRVAGRPGGPEAAAREARYEALLAAARRHDAAAVLLGHTRDDQAETVLLALARGGGPRGLAGMPERREWAGVPLLRPLLDVGREDTRKACAALGLTPWEDPHNADPAYARSRVRADLLPALVDALGPGVVDNLARTARLLAADTAALDALAAAALADARTVEGGLSVSALAALPTAVRTRVLHAWARELGASPAALSHRHVAALDALVTAWHGQGPVHLPGGIPVARRAGRLTT
ncbi:MULTISPECIES: tRNA lysidine(34) synthetase TilS [Micromonospora]|uniref:tRNA(Ile)-lysidine synthase n=1 Tax=Micromonospora solifontis TaxID=2487138 RepID=A0ABX9WHU9_9ACTN|nr:MULTISPECIES: tRNA lysidine(34) synthetase TilS [Micromonospora]NES14723.1 tRNA lysidine(34) synthetase TilS [Micromonospora sp. PPF5-17B]NES36704.1 tRNA lysidine(34) synthetase TilS [Micromonospora solifontis]NES55731.1 tRNA lysidine(34) synthetase TilS [Micromonospora sp. PPF5-6]RNL99165.1 tRNA lysidine(34) synthetase TilS [Micromonospora solifontis]